MLPIPLILWGSLYYQRRIIGILPAVDVPGMNLPRAESFEDGGIFCTDFDWKLRRDRHHQDLGPGSAGQPQELGEDDALPTLVLGAADDDERAGSIRGFHQVCQRADAPSGSGGASVKMGKNEPATVCLSLGVRYQSIGRWMTSTCSLG
jgi:hypothetical protein